MSNVGNGVELVAVMRNGGELRGNIGPPRKICILCLWEWWYWGRPFAKVEESETSLSFVSIVVWICSMLALFLAAQQARQSYERYNGKLLIIEARSKVERPYSVL